MYDRDVKNEELLSFPTTLLSEVISSSEPILGLSLMQHLQFPYSSRVVVSAMLIEQVGVHCTPYW